ncbi:glycosyltransferase [Strepomyces sp. STD 3.1]|nr:glycosyltransferase [Streptomyces sp. STD 3.1]
MKTVFMFPNDPNPRFIKRMKFTCENGLKTYLIYWNRGINTPYTLPDNVVCYPVNLKVKLGDRIKKFFLLPIFLYKGLIRLIKIKPDIIHVGLIDMLFTATIYKTFFNKKVKIIYEIGDLPKFIINKHSGIKEILRKFIVYLEKKLSKGISLLILTSPYFWDEYYQEFVEEEKYLYIANAPSKELFGKFKKKDLNGRIVIGYIGFVRYKKQILNLIDAVRKYKDTFEIYIAGEGPDAKEIREYIVNTNAGDFVTMSGAYNYSRDILNIYSKVDIVYSVYDTSFENVKLALPNKLYEAIVCELPMIVAKNTQLEKFVLDYKIGYSVDDQDVEDLSNLLKLIKEDPRVLENASQLSPEIKNSNFVEEYNKKLLLKYKSLLKEIDSSKSFN